jgi:hypothetical protein
MALSSLIARLKIWDGAETLEITAANAAKVDGSAVTQPVSDAGGSLTVDGTFWQATQPVSGTVTANAGTNLNTSSLALESGGNLAAQTTALQLLDNIVLAEDAASATGDPGVNLLAVRKATPANTSGTDGDYESLQVSAGRLWASATIDAAIPAGTNNIGDVDLASAIPAGTNNIGDVDVLTLPAIPAGNNNIGDVDVASIAAGTNVIGRVAGMEATGTIYNGTTATTPAYAAIDAATSGDNTLVAAAGASNKIRVYALFLVAAGTVTARFESGAGGTALSGQMNLIANTGFVLPYNPLGWFETAANTLLNLELSAAVSVDGSLTYSVVQ